MENYGKQTGKDETPMQWHTLSENLMDLGSENREQSKEESDNPLPQENIQPQEEKFIANHPVPPGRMESVEIKKMPSRKKKKPIWAIFAAVFALLLVTGAVLFYFTVHRWTEPSCTEASVCTICGKQGSPAAGHQWIPATCTAVKTCSVCRETEGTPLGHDFKDTVSYNYIKCTKESWKECSRCDYRTGSQPELLTSFLDDTKEFFRMSPNEFKEKLEFLASYFEPAERGLDTIPFFDAISFDDLKNVTFEWVNDDSATWGLPILNCYSGSEIIFNLELYNLNKDEIEEVDRDRPSSFNCVTITNIYDSQKTASVYHSMEIILVNVCDPDADKLTTLQLAAAANSGGRMEHNDLIYGSSDSSYNIVTRKMVEKIILTDS